jgi:hypothetical protein
VVVEWLDCGYAEGHVAHIRAADRSGQAAQAPGRDPNRLLVIGAVSLVGVAAVVVLAYLFAVFDPMPHVPVEPPEVTASPAVDYTLVGPPVWGVFLVRIRAADGWVWRPWGRGIRAPPPSMVRGAGLVTSCLF